MCCGPLPVNNGLDGNLGTLSYGETLMYRSCEVNEDCVYAQNGCCDCANGGEDIAVNKDLKETFSRLFTLSCGNVACTMVGAIPACGTGTVECSAGICEFIPGLNNNPTLLEE